MWPASPSKNLQGANWPKPDLLGWNLHLQGTNPHLRGGLSFVKLGKELIYWRLLNF